MPYLVKLGKFLFADVVELLELVAAKCAGHDRKLDRQRIDWLAFDSEFVVKVRSGGPACLSDIADGLALAELASLA